MRLTCPKCTAPFEEGSKFCETCGCNLEREYIENPVCPECRTSYSTNINYCVNDGVKLVHPRDLVPQCEVCHTTYSEDIKFCPRDGGTVKVRYAKAFTPGSSGSQSTNDGFHGRSTTQQAGNDYSLHLDDYGTGPYPKASLGRRFVAYLLDAFFTLLLSIPAAGIAWLGVVKMMEFDMHSAWGSFIVAGLLAIIPVVYSLVKDGMGEGQSWGKGAMNLMVVNLDDRTPCTKANSFVRNFVSGLLGCIPYVGWLIEPIVLMVTQDGKKVGDMAARTQVIETSDF